MKDTGPAMQKDTQLTPAFERPPLGGQGWAPLRAAPTPLTHNPGTQ